MIYKNTNNHIKIILYIIYIDYLKWISFNKENDRFKIRFQQNCSGDECFNILIKIIFNIFELNNIYQTYNKYK